MRLIPIQTLLDRSHTVQYVNGKKVDPQKELKNAWQNWLKKWPGRRGCD